MTAFVKETEPLLERGQGQVIRPDERMWNLRSLVTFCRPSILEMPLQFHSYKISTMETGALTEIFVQFSSVSKKLVLQSFATIFSFECIIEALCAILGPGDR